MAVDLNHTIVAARDAETSARWFAELFGVAGPEPVVHFWQITTGNGVGLDFSSTSDDDIASQHYAFTVSDPEFDAIFGRITARGLEHWADPMLRQAGAINRRFGGRGVYFMSNDGHLLEIFTLPHGTGG